MTRRRPTWWPLRAATRRSSPVAISSPPARRVAEACPGLAIQRLKSGPLGGDQQIGAPIAEAKVDALIFFVDPLTPMPHDVDVKALMRLAIVYDIPMALNHATAEIVLLKKASGA